MSVLNSLRRSRGWRMMLQPLRVLGPFLPSSVYSRLWFEGNFLAKVDGCRFWMEHGGRVLENEVFWKNTFKAEGGTVAAFRGALRDAQVFIDVGANTGFYSLLAKSASPGCSVVAFEPSAANYAILKQNILLNGFDVEAREIAITRNDGPVTLHDFPGASYSASLESSWRPGTVERTVDGWSLDTVAERHALSGKQILVKLDIEGHEGEALAGAAALIHQDPTPWFLVEIIRDYVANGVRDALGTDRFSYLLVDDVSGILTDVTPDLASADPHPPLGNYFIVPKETQVPAEWKIKA